MFPKLERWGYFAWGIAWVALMCLLPYLVALPIALALFTLRAPAAAFRAELAALLRADEGATVLGRLHRGDGKKE